MFDEEMVSSQTQHDRSGRQQEGSGRNVWVKKQEVILEEGGGRGQMK